MFGKRAGEFSSPIPLFHDIAITLTEKDFAKGKRFFVNFFHSPANCELYRLA